MNKLLFLVALVPLLVLAPSLSYGSVTPAQHKFMHDKISEALTHAGIIAIADLSGGGGFDEGAKMEHEILAIVDNSTANVEKCLS
jgi:hypothetical protein